MVALFDAFADDAERAALRAELRAGLGWGDAKARVVARLERELGPLRDRYEALMAQPERIEEALRAGAAKARALAAPFLAELRRAVGLRPMVVAAPAPAGEVRARAALPSFKQYREADGKFYFKFVAADGRVLLQSAAFASGRDAGQWVARLKADPASSAAAPVARGEGASAADVELALAALAGAAAAAN